MAITVNATNYDGSLDEFVYLVMGLGNDVAQKGAIHMIPNVSSKIQLDYMTTEEDPFNDYSDAQPSFTGVTTKYKNDLEPQKFQMDGIITPSAWMSVWKKYSSKGNLTGLRANPALLRDVIMLIKNAANNQLSKLIWQGDTAAGGASPLRFFDGLIKLIDASADTINVTPAGAITQANVSAILESVYTAIPDKFIENPDFKIIMSTADFRLLQLFNNSVNETTNGILAKNVQRLFLEQRIEHFQYLPKNHIIGAVAKQTEDSNLVLGMYYDLEQEFNAININYIGSHDMRVGYRVNMMAGVQCRYFGDIVFYEPV